MRVRARNLRFETGVYELSSVLTPSLYAYECDGQLESAQALAQKTADAFGRLADLLVERGVIRLDEAVDASGCHYDHVEAWGR